MRVAETITAASRQALYRGLRDAQGARFLGIRYAWDPVGPLRFKPPVPCEHQGLVDTTRVGAAPPQTMQPLPEWAPRRAGFVTGEDCLNLNVYTPAVDDARRPVVVHAFGGGFQSGAAHGTFHDDAGFVRRGDVVLVRPNMRIGALGFLHLEETFGPEYAAANRGMLDFIAAVRWVHDNIAGFGGDPDNVTLVGMSSGAFTISALFGVEGIAHLYRRIWVMSGPASRIIAAQTAGALAADFLGRVGVAPGDAAGLQRLPVATLLAVQEQVLATHLGARNAPGGRTFGIVQDGASLQRHPLDGIASGRFRDHRIVAGWTRDEARMWYALGLMPDVASRDQLLAAVARFHPDDAADRLAALEAELPGLSFTRYEEVFLSRTIYRDPALRMLAAHAAQGGVGYGYEFAWAPTDEHGRLGAAHGFDEPFVFDSATPDRVPLVRGDPRAAALNRTMSQEFLRFARTGSVAWANDHAAGDVKVFD